MPVVPKILSYIKRVFFSGMTVSLDTISAASFYVF